MSAFSRALQRTFFAMGRGLFPVAHFGKRIFVFRDADVREILERDQDFTIRQINDVNLQRLLGTFTLGLDRGTILAEEQAAIHAVAYKEDLPRIQEWAREAVENTLASLPAGRPVNWVTDYILHIPYRLLEFYIGTPGPDKATMLHWNRTLFWDAFLNLNRDKAVEAEAVKSAAALKAYLENLIAEMKAAILQGQRVPDTLLSRLIRNQLKGEFALDDDGIRRNITGILLGIGQNYLKSISAMITQMQARPKVWEKAQQAANAGDLVAIRQLSFDAMRFHSPIPVIIRWNEHAQTVGAANGKARKLKPGKEIFAFTSSAMMDPRRWKHPKQVRADRPLMDYLYFGLGLHKCYGEHVNYILMPEMMAGILRHPEWKPIGKMISEGPFPKEWNWQKG